jgi:Zn-dependent alcohol dehydrogenase
MGSSGYRHGRLPALMDLMVKTMDQVPYDEVISDQFSLEQVNEAMAESEWSNRSTTVVRAVLTP